MTMEVKRISVLGCGWLGKALALDLRGKGYIVKGSRRHVLEDDELKQCGVEMYRVDVQDVKTDYDSADFFNSDVLIINFPPGRTAEQTGKHVLQIKNLLPVLRRYDVKKTIFISSTSVYPDSNREVFEEDAENPEKPGGQALLRAEQMMMDEEGLQTTVIRFGGLIGYDRVPGKFLAGKKELKDGNAPVNLIHRDDAIAIIHRVLELNKFGVVYNAVCDAHPTRRQFYTRAAQKAGLALPEFREEADCRYKIVKNDKLKRELHFQFTFPDPTDVLV